MGTGFPVKSCVNKQMPTMIDYEATVVWSGRV